MERREIIIIGGGPAGAATALYLARRDPALARRALVLEKARHPRAKVCAGGLIPHALACLDELEVGLTVPHVVVDRARVEVPGRRVEVDGRRCCAIVRRAEFDASLVRAARARGVEVREEERVRTLERVGDGVVVTTDRGRYHASLVVGADGSGSLVRRVLVDGHGHRNRDAHGERRAIGRAVMADVPIGDAGSWDGHDRARYDFDFRAVPAGLAGYAWAFPCLIDGRPHVNAGVYARRAGVGPDLRALLHALQVDLGGARVRHQAAPIRCWSRAPFTADRTLLVGDAAGAEPLMGEGISFAFEYGRWAAAEVAAAAAAGTLEWPAAEARFRRSWVGRKLRRLDQAATMFYGRGARLWLALAARWGGAQRIGLCWYNGVDGWDRRSGWAALRATLGGSAVATARTGMQ
ncbi:MAG: FAD-dependent monooxygenase [Deltaproteobacteria bacterium]|nr:FAD-dependent monooxygenase [Deltaproteobacteria bacterium]